MIHVNDTYNNIDYNWSYDKFVERLMQMRDVYQNWKFYGEVFVLFLECVMMTCIA